LTDLTRTLEHVGDDPAAPLRAWQVVEEYAAYADEKFSAFAQRAIARELQRLTLREQLRSRATSGKTRPKMGKNISSIPVSS
jgi:hypothetical protein